MVPENKIEDTLKSFKHSYKVTQKELAAMTVYNCGSQRCTPDYQWGPGQRDHFLIHYVISGSGTYQSGGKTYAVIKGDAFLVHPNTIITYKADHKTPWHYCWVGFSGIDARLLIHQMPFTEESPVIQMENGSDIQEAFKKIWRARGTNFESRIHMTGELYSALSLFISQEQEHASPSVRYFERAVDYIKKNYFFYNLSVESIAEILNINRSYLYMIFKDTCGLSPKEYLTDFRIKQACTLLIQSRISITSVSYSVGYEDNMYFSKVFRKVMGMTPSKYRELYRIH